MEGQGIIISAELLGRCKGAADMGTWLWMLMQANHEDFMWRGILIERGQFVTTVAAMAEATNQTVRQTRGKLCDKQRANEIIKESTNSYTIITICNFDSYITSFEDKIEVEKNTEGQTKGKRRANEGQTEERRKEDKEERISPLKENIPLKGNTKEKLPQAPSDTDLSFIPDQRLREKFAEWLDYRVRIIKIRIKDPRRSYNYLMGPKRADGDIELALDIIDFSMAQQYQGLILDKSILTKNGRPQQKPTDYRIALGGNSPGQEGYGQSTI